MKERRQEIAKPVRSRKKITLEKPAVKDEPVEWLELFPYGITMGTEPGRPLLILKDAAQEEVLPVWINPVEAGIALSEFSTLPATPHGVVEKLMGALGVKLERCEISEMVGHHQYVVLKFAGAEKIVDLRLRADEAMSFCLAQKVRFFSKKEFMAQCRNLDAQMEVLENRMRTQPEIGSKNHPYVI